MSVDVRTRSDGDEPPLDPEILLDQVIPEALEARGDLLGPAALALDPPPLVLVIEGNGGGDTSAGNGGGGGRKRSREAWRLQAQRGRISIERLGTRNERSPGAARSCVVRLQPDQLADLVHDQVTPMGWFTSGRLSLDGRLEDLLDWWMLVRGALDQVAPHVPGQPLPEGIAGASSKEVRRSFSADDPGSRIGTSWNATGSCTLRACSSRPRWPRCQWRWNG